MVQPGRNFGCSKPSCYWWTRLLRVVFPIHEDRRAYRLVLISLLANPPGVPSPVENRQKAGIEAEVFRLQRYGSVSQMDGETPFWVVETAGARFSESCETAVIPSVETGS